MTQYCKLLQSNYCFFFLGYPIFFKFGSKASYIHWRSSWYSVPLQIVVCCDTVTVAEWRH